MKKTKLFLDTEFTGLHQKTTLISLGIVSECGKSFYAEFTDYDKSQVDNWIQENVVANLFLNGDCITPDLIEIKDSTKVISDCLRVWLSKFDKIEIWSDCLAYDWVLFNNIFGTAFDIPKNVFYIPFDISTLFKIKNIDPDISREFYIDNIVEGNKHNALYDARVIKACYEKLMSKNA